jgi:hypothetical protein
LNPVFFKAVHHVREMNHLEQFVNRTNKFVELLAEPRGTNCLFALVLFQSDTHTLDSRVCQILEEKSKKE